MAREVEVSPCSFNISVNIVTMLPEPLSKALAGLPDILLPAPVHSAADAIADVLAVAVQLGIEVHPVVG